jgi:hypothetical protein
MKVTRFTFGILSAALIWSVGCAGFSNHSDSLAGWKADLNHQPDPAILKDCQDYIQHQPSNIRDNVGPIGYLTDGAVRHAVDVEIFVPGKNALWHYFLIYDTNNKRIKVIKYGYTRFMSA